ncbi:protein-tyrosine phosphatase-like protein [Baffinella frigidus]|nr:protein-tyrosine phosphatase-like protein [Cryptophyta sp. CCMP2293]
MHRAGPVRNSGRSTRSEDGKQRLQWGQSDETFNLSTAKEGPLPGFRPSGRLYIATMSRPPAEMPCTHFFTIDAEMTYLPFCADFGPINLGHTFNFLRKLTGIFTDPTLEGKRIVCCTPRGQAEVTNVIYLLGAFLCLSLSAKPDAAWHPFANAFKDVCKPFRDATWVKSTYDLHGLVKATSEGLFDPVDFDEEEYFYYDPPLNGDMHEVVPNKFYAFKGPSDRRGLSDTAHYALLPSDYIRVFKYKELEGASEFTKHDLVHHDLFFTDCSTPSDQIVHAFLVISENAQRPLAVHCLAGLGRTGTLIALWMMKHMKFTANEAIAWLRIVRPGSVIGPQQAYLVEQEPRMHELGARPGVSGLGMADGYNWTTHVDWTPGNVRRAPARSGEHSSILAKMITQGMQNRHQRGSPGVVEATEHAGCA